MKFISLLPLLLLASPLALADEKADAIAQLMDAGHRVFVHCMVGPRVY